MTETTGKTILIVDDEPDIVTYLSTLLEDNGFRVITAGDGRAGEEAARRARPALILLDISMPEESGVRMFRNLQEDSSTSAIPVIIITGVSHDFKRFIETRRQVRPPAGYFDKPPNPDQLLAKINEILETKSIA
jgi:DNA-binding response OmpR family regulator